MDELWDEGAIAQGGASESEIGAALLMADLEAAIVAAGDEIAALRRLTEATPRPAPPPAPVGSDEAAASPGELVDRAISSGAVTPGRDDNRAIPRPATTQDLSRTSPDAVVPDVVGAAGLRTDEAATAPGRALQAGDPGSAGMKTGTLGASRPGKAQFLALPPAIVEATPAPAALTIDRPGSVAGWQGPSVVDDAHDNLVAPPRWPVAGAPVAGSARLLEPEADEQRSSWLGQRAGGQAAPVAAEVGGRGTSMPADAQAFGGMASEARDGASPSQGGAHAGPTEGDVYLDGERVGRWMARHLARELGGPQAGGTGFDPRLGPAWPGSLHGN